jgi:hypothetical protein
VLETLLCKDLANPTPHSKKGTRSDLVQWKDHPRNSRVNNVAPERFVLLRRFAGFSTNLGHQVKCDRRITGCLRCERLELTCSYVAGDTIEVSGSHGEDLTQAGIKRRRILRACAACRSAKSKCSGTCPCNRCQSQGQECLFGDEPGSSSVDVGIEVQTSPASTSQSHYGSVPSQASPMDISASAASDTQRYVPVIEAFCLWLTFQKDL